MNLVYKTFLALLISLFFYGNSHGQWLQEKGSAYVKLGTWHILADQHYTTSNQADENATRGLWINSLFFQYGISNNINLVGYLPFLVSAYSYAQVSLVNDEVLIPEGRLYSLGDTDLSLEVGLFKLKSWVFSSSLKFSIPTGNSTGIPEEDIDHPKLLEIRNSFQTGDGEFNQQLGINLGTSYTLWNTPAYFKTNLGYNNRTKGYSDEFHIALETGLQLFENRFLILGSAHLTKSTYNGDLEGQDDGSFFANNLESLALRAETAFELFNNAGISFGVSYPVWGRLVFKDMVYSGGIYLNY